MKISKEQLLQQASITDFRPEMFEKVWYLMALLNGIYAHPYLKNRVALKGGTALNLFSFPLPRLSVDIDLNYIGQTDKNLMLEERPIVEKALKAVCKSEAMEIVREPNDHAGGKFEIKYESALNSYGNLAFDINYMYRVPLWNIEQKSQLM